MLKKILASLAIVWLFIAILIPSFLAPKIEKEIHAFFTGAEIQRLQQKGIDLHLESYQRGYFSSTADIHLSIRPFPEQPTWYRTILHTRINHAPFVNSGLNLFSATAVNSTSTGTLSTYIPDGTLRLKSSLAILGQLHQIIRLQKNEAPSLSSDGLSLSWHSHIRYPERGRGEWLLGQQQWLKNGRHLDIARSSGTYRSDGESIRFNAAQLSIQHRDLAQNKLQFTIYNLQGDLTRRELRFNIEDMNVKSENSYGIKDNQRLQQTVISMHNRENGSMRNLEAQTTATFELPILKSVNGDRLYFSLQQEAEGYRLIITSNEGQTTHISGSLLFPLLFPPPYSSDQLNGTHGKFLIYGIYAKKSGLLPLLSFILDKDRLQPDDDGNYLLNVDVNGKQVRVNGKALFLLP
ncbi:MAG: DUF945 family protein [Cardiobacteriaceae bacterium]|nr:DUF945 family protein [Cardiobacteriaceae bacterium]